VGGLIAEMLLVLFVLYNTTQVRRAGGGLGRFLRFLDMINILKQTIQNVKLLHIYLGCKCSKLNPTSSSDA